MSSSQQNNNNSPRESCYVRTRNAFGFNPIDSEANTVLDVQRSLFRFWVSRNTEVWNWVWMVLAFAIHAGTMFTSLNDFSDFCKSRTTDSTDPGPSCKMDWILYGPNQVSLMLFLTLLISLLNCYFYSGSSTFERIPPSVVAQWILEVTTYNFVFLSFCVLFIEWRGDSHPAYIQDDQKSMLAITIISILLKFTEFRWRHVIWIQFIYMMHVFFVLTVDAITGIFADEPLMELVSLDFFRGVLAIGGVLNLITVILIVVHKIKLYLVTNNRSLMISSVIADIIPNGDEDEESPDEHGKYIPGVVAS